MKRPLLSDLTTVGTTLGHVFLTGIYLFLLLAGACCLLVDGFIVDELPRGEKA